MIRFCAVGERDGKPVHIVGLGLSEENLTRLRADKPVYVKGDTVGLPGAEIIIFWGRTEYELTESVAKFIGPQTEVRRLTRSELPPDHKDYRPE